MAYETRLKQTEDKKAALKQDTFLTTTGGLHLTTETRKSVIVTTSILLAVILVLVAAGVIWNKRSDAAATAFGNAMQVLQSQLAVAGQPALPGVKTYASAAERAQAAMPLFTAVADQYSLTKDGKTARYFAGITAIDAGQTQTAETTLQKVAGGFDKDLSNLAKLALADLYHQSGRDAQAVELYNQITDHPTSTVPAATAQISLAELYSAQGKTEMARKIYAQVKDKDPKGVAGTVAAAKLNPAAANGPQQ